jgi:hypothetical protein
MDTGDIVFCMLFLSVLGFTLFMMLLDVYGDSLKRKIRIFRTACRLRMSDSKLSENVRPVDRRISSLLFKEDPGVKWVDPINKRTSTPFVKIWERMLAIYLLKREQYNDAASRGDCNSNAQLDLLSRHFEVGATSFSLSKLEADIYLYGSGLLILQELRGSLALPGISWSHIIEKASDLEKKVKAKSEDPGVTVSGLMLELLDNSIGEDHQNDLEDMEHRIQTSQVKVL